VNEHSTPASEDSPVQEDTQSLPASAPVRSRTLPRAGLVAAAATSRTAGWIVAAGLLGSLITLLAGPGSNSPATIVALHRAAFAVPGGRRSAAPGKRAYVQMPARQKIVGVPAGLPPGAGPLAPGQIAGPGSVWVQVPAMMPACGIIGPGMVSPGVQRVYVPGRQAKIQRVFVRPGKNGKRIELVRPGAVPSKQFVSGSGSISLIGPGGSPCAVSIHGGFRGALRSSWYGPGWSAPYVSWYSR
jgi:hypothetical protein